MRALRVQRRAGEFYRERLGLSDNWLRHVQDVRQKYDQALERLGENEAKLARLCELNVMEQAVNVCHTTVVREAWERGQELTVHGWIYSLADGLVKDLGMTVNRPDEVGNVLQRALSLPARR